MWPRRLARWLFIGVPCGLVLAVGGILPVAEWVALATVFAAVLLHGWHRARVRKPMTLSPFVLGGLVALALAWLAAIPLPTALVGLLSPLAEGAQHAFARASGQESQLIPLSLDAVSSLRLTRRIALYTLVFLMAVPLGRKPDTLRHVLRAVGGLGGVFVAIAGLNALAADGTILGIFRPHTPLQPATATLVNSNHSAALLGMTLPVTVGLFATTRSRRGLVGWGVGALTQLGLLLITPSGNALLAPFFLAALLAFFAVRSRTHDPERRRTPRSARSAVLLGLAVIVGLIVVQAAFEPIREVASGAVRFDKLEVLRKGFGLVPDFPLTGVGPGAFLFAFGAFGPSSGVALTAPESLPLQALLDYGLPAGLALLTFGLVGLGRVARAAHTDRLLAGLVVAVLGFVVHEAADFAINLPGTGSLFFALFGLALGATDPGRGRLAVRRVPPLAVALLAAGVAAVGALGAYVGEEVLPRRAWVRWDPSSDHPAPGPVEQAIGAGRFYPLDGRVWMRVGVLERTAGHRDVGRTWLEYAAGVMPQSARVLEALARAVRESSPPRHAEVLAQMVERFWGAPRSGAALDFIVAEILRSPALREAPKGILGEGAERVRQYLRAVAGLPMETRRSALRGVLHDYRADLAALLLLDRALEGPELAVLRDLWLATLFSEHDRAPETWVALARAATAKGEHEKAHAHLLRASRLRGGPDTQVTPLLAEVCLRLGRVDEAAEAVTALDVLPAVNEVRRGVLKARLAEAQGRPSAALAILDHLLIDQPTAAAARALRARILTDTGRWQAARDDYLRLHRQTGKAGFQERANELQRRLTPRDVPVREGAAP